ncbi:MAG: glycosyltransferase family 4 protein [Candidatus Endonucleobacter bathymodioli]|uniref:Glycosyltransferase family 4 protein n=1 Tax=Candidatus Endonucleibacter bathymodioli TaxID=539814 RepID=A0AA90NX63_9GAMM|nr:glycosyltransferase family 4 protein [Candidatus Endonucleobacter bathymodioli]
MKLNFALFNYFPYGGLQRDCIKTAIECQKLNHSINIYTTEWDGDRPKGFNIHLLPVTGLSNHQRMTNFQNKLLKVTKQEPGHFLIGFNKLAGLDVYFASDPCYREKVIKERNFFYRLSPRYKAYEQLEREVFKPSSNTFILTLTEQQKHDFQKQYQTQESRFKLLPPGAGKKLFLQDKSHIRAEYRKQFNISENSNLLLMVGSSFKTKGLDRTIAALAFLSTLRLKDTRLLVVGRDNREPFVKQATGLKIIDNIIFCGARSDVTKLMLCADALIHPAYTESAGMVLVEALAAGLPVLTTSNCGYAYHIEAANAGIVSPTPFNQNMFNHSLLEILNADRLKQCHENAINYASNTDIYSLHKQAAKVINTLLEK